MRLKLPRLLARPGTPPTPERAPEEEPGYADTPREVMVADRRTGQIPAEGTSLPAPGGQPITPVVVPHWIQFVILPLALLALWAIAKAIGSLLVILTIAALLALVLNPLARLLERGLPRALSIIATYLAALLVIGGIGLLLSDPVSTSVSRFSDHLPHITRTANQDIVDVQNFFNRHGINLHIRQQGRTALQSLEKKLAKSSGTIISFSRDLLGKLVTLSVDFILTLVLSVYLLAYAPAIGRVVRRVMPTGNGTPEDDFPLLIQRAVAGYIRGQLAFSVVMGSSAGLMLYVLGLTGVFPDGRHYAFFFGFFYGLAELIPYIGPFIGPVPAILTALLSTPIAALWLLLAFVVLQQLEGHLIAPQIFRITLRINPILVIVALLIGYQLEGVIGALIALPLATVIRATTLYLRRHLVLEPWSTVVPIRTRAGPLQPEARRPPADHEERQDDPDPARAPARR